MSSIRRFLCLFFSVGVAVSYASSQTDGWKKEVQAGIEVFNSSNSAKIKLIPAQSARIERMGNASKMCKLVLRGF
jgi:hypothetical protein